MLFREYVETMYMRNRIVFTGMFLLFNSFAMAGYGITFHGKILKPDGVTPVTSTTTQFRIQVRSPDNCILWEEQQTKDLSSSNGIFTITIADSSEPTLIPNSLPFPLERTFSNRTAFTGLTGCTTGTSYTPNLSDGRNLAVAFREVPTDPWESMPISKVNYVPLSLNSLQLAGYQASEFLKIDSASTYTPLTATQVNTLMDIIAGTSTSYLRPASTFTGDVSGTYNATSVDKIKGVAVSTTAPTNGQVLKYNGTAWAPAADDSGSSSDASYTAKGVVQINTDQATSGLLIASGVLALPNIITAGGPIGGASTVPIITYDQKGRLTAVSTATVDDTTKLPLAGGTMTGSINMGTQNITNATNISATNVSATNASIRNLILNDNDTNTVTLRTPTDVTTNYVLQLPADDGTSGQVLSSDGSGVLSWVAANSSLGLTSNRAVITNGTGSALTNFTCSLGQVMGFDGSGTPVCTDVTTAGGFINAGNSFGAAATLGTNDNFALNFETNGSNKMTILGNGDVGIGTTSPASILDINGAFTQRGMAAPSVSPAGQGRIYFDSTSNKFRVSENGVAYTDLVTSVSGSGGFVDGGNTFTADATLGTNSNHALNFETNGATKMTILANGNVGIGATNPGALLEVRTNPWDANSGTFKSQYNFTIFNNPAASTATVLGIDNEISASNTGTKNIVTAAYNRVSVAPDSGQITAAIADDSNIYSTSAGTITSATGVNATVTNASTGTISTAQGLYSGISNSSTGSVTNGYGLFIGNIEATNSFGVYQQSALSKNFFGGRVGIGTSNPQNSLDVTGGVALGSYAGVSSAGTGSLILPEKLGVGTSNPAVDLEVRKLSPIMMLTDTANSTATGLTRLMPGVQLSSKGLSTTNMYGAALKFGSHDGSFTTENPKFLAAVAPRATQNYTADNRGGMALDFATTPNTPGVNSVPLVRMTIDHTGYVGIGATSPTAPLDVAGHMANTGPSSSVNSCGTGATITGNDTRGYVATGTGTVNSCAISFANAFASSPICVVTWRGAASATGLGVSATTTTLTVYFSASSPSVNFNYFCMQ